MVYSLYMFARLDACCMLCLRAWVLVRHTVIWHHRKSLVSSMVIVTTQDAQSNVDVLAVQQR